MKYRLINSFAKYDQKHDGTEIFLVCITLSDGYIDIQFNILHKTLVGMEYLYYKDGLPLDKEIKSKGMLSFPSYNSIPLTGVNITEKTTERYYNDLIFNDVDQLSIYIIYLFDKYRKIIHKYMRAYNASNKLHDS